MVNSIALENGGASTENLLIKGWQSFKRTCLGGSNSEPSLASSQDYSKLFRDTVVEPERRGFFNRSLRAIIIMYNERGLCHTSAKLAFSALLTTYIGVSTFFEIEGSVFSIKEMWGRGDTVGRELGDFGGWASLAFIDIVGLLLFLQNEITEAEYIGLKNECQIFINRIEISKSDLYNAFLIRLDCLNSDCLFSKTVASRILTALDLLGPPDQEALEAESNWAKDYALMNILRGIEEEYRKGCFAKRYFNFLYQGQKEIKKKSGLKGVITHLTLGVGGPLFLVANIVNDFLGIWKLWEEVGKEDPERGHLGEWASNALQNGIISTWLHSKYAFNPGRLVVIKQIYQEALLGLKHPSLHTRLREIANKQLLELGSEGPIFAKDFYSPLDYDVAELLSTLN